MPGSHDPKVEVDYNVVLADMKARHAALGQSIASMEAWLKGGGAPAGDFGASHNGHSTTKIDIDTFAGLNIPNATSKYLRMVGKPARTTDIITKALNDGGLKCNQASVATVLGRSIASGDIYKVGRGVWGLKEWYASSNAGMKG
jgi:hypothetical protein